jgi:hypothetical protein
VTEEPLEGWKCFALKLQDENRELKIQMSRGQRDEIAKQLEMAERNLELTMKLEEKEK